MRLISLGGEAYGLRDREARERAALEAQVRILFLFFLFFSCVFICSYLFAYILLNVYTLCLYNVLQDERITKNSSVFYPCDFFCVFLGKFSTNSVA